MDRDPKSILRQNTSEITLHLVAEWLQHWKIDMISIGHFIGNIIIAFFFFFNLCCSNNNVCPYGEIGGIICCPSGSSSTLCNGQCVLMELRL